MKKVSKKSKRIIFFLGLILFSMMICCIFVMQNKDEKTTNDFYPTNKNGQTYGSAMHADTYGYPDLILALGDNGKEGYVTQVDFFGRNSDEYKHYERKVTSEAILEQLRKQYKEEYSNYTELEFYQICYDIPLYDESGEKVIGKVIRTIETLPYQ